MCNCTDHDSTQFTCLSAISLVYNNFGLSCRWQFHQYQVVGGAGSANCYQKDNLCCMLLSLDSVILFYFGVLQIFEKHPKSIKTVGVLVRYQSQTGATLEFPFATGESRVKM